MAYSSADAHFVIFSRHLSMLPHQISPQKTEVSRVSYMADQVSHEGREVTAKHGNETGVPGSPRAEIIEGKVERQVESKGGSEADPLSLVRTRITRHKNVLVEITLIGHLLIVIAQTSS